MGLRSAKTNVCFDRSKISCKADIDYVFGVNTLPHKMRLEKLVFRLIVMFLPTEIFSKRRKIYSWMKRNQSYRSSTFLKSYPAMVSNIMVCKAYKHGFFCCNCDKRYSYSPTKALVQPRRWPGTAQQRHLYRRVEPFWDAFGTQLVYLKYLAVLQIQIMNL